MDFKELYENGFPDAEVDPFYELSPLQRIRESGKIIAYSLKVILDGGPPYSPDGEMTYVDYLVETLCATARLISETYCSGEVSFANEKLYDHVVNYFEEIKALLPKEDHTKIDQFFFRCEKKYEDNQGLRLEFKDYKSRF